MLIFAIARLASGIDTTPPAETVKFAHVVVPVREAESAFAFNAKAAFTVLMSAFNASAEFTVVATALASKLLWRLLIFAIVRLASGIDTVPPAETVKFAHVVVPVREGDAVFAFKARAEFTVVESALASKLV